jgi:hypothetical protein
MSNLKRDHPPSNRAQHCLISVIEMNRITNVNKIHFLSFGFPWQNVRVKFYILTIQFRMDLQARLVTPDRTAINDHFARAIVRSSERRKENEKACSQDHNGI